MYDPFAKSPPPLPHGRGSFKTPYGQRASVWLTCGLGIAAFLGGCSTDHVPVAPTTMLNSVDLVRTTDLMAGSLLASDVDLGGKVIVTDRVVNRTNHMMPQGERELFLVRLRAALAQNEDLRRAGVVFVARPDELTDFTAPPPEDAQGSGPTHALTATFRTLTNITRLERDDYYECAFQLQDLRTRAIVWEDAYNVRYAVERGKFQ